jgi:hypothetical protein
MQLMLEKETSSPLNRSLLPETGDHFLSLKAII